MHRCIFTIMYIYLFIYTYTILISRTLASIKKPLPIGARSDRFRAEREKLTQF